MTPDQTFRSNKWGVEIVKRGTDYDVANVVKNKGFPDAQIIARAMWPDDAMRVCNEHNEAMAVALFPQEVKPC